MFICLLSLASWGAQEPSEIRLQDSKGSPVKHAVIRVGENQVITTNSDGKVKIHLSDYDESTEFEVYAMGYEKVHLTIGDLKLRPLVVMKESLGQLDEFVLSATRTDRSVEDLPMPVKVLTAKKIRETGAFRLSDILVEQTGLQLVADHGTGLQMQGLDSDYILILLDGEPLIGKTAGTFDLDRISVTNIERIEILRGPSSAIYGSEAMAGTVNIITKNQEDNFTANILAKYGSFKSLDLGTEVGINANGWKAYGYFNHFQTDGYDLNPERLGHTKAPFEAQTAQVKLSRELGKRWKTKLSGRFYDEHYEDQIAANRDGEAAEAEMQGSRRELNINPSIVFKPNADWTFTLRHMTSLFDTRSSSVFREDRSLLDQEDFFQNYHRTELQNDHRLNDQHLITVGLGHQVESVEATRYDNVNSFSSGYLYLQHQWSPSAKWNVVSGARGDLHSQYGGRVSPKVSAIYKFSDSFSWQASVGAGFKSPDFRQLLLNFNNAAVGYYVYGANLVEAGVKQLQEQGHVQQVLMDPAVFGELNAEHSWAFNTGFRWKLTDDLLLNTNFYRNQIYNLIETSAVARLTNGQHVYSYLNLNEVITQGMELDINCRVGSQWSFSLGYAYLDSRDEEVLEGIENGEYFKRNAQNQTKRVVRADYGGLFNRSRHSGNVKVNYWEKHTGVNIALRGIYRGKYGFGDINGNQILDDDSEYADGIMQVHLTLDKQFDRGIRLEAGARNITNALNQYDGTNPGRTYFVSIHAALGDLLR